MKQRQALKIQQKKGTRLNAIRKLKKYATAKGRKPSSVKKNIFVTKADKFINSVLAAKEIDQYCQHYLVGSSSVLAFLKGTHSFTKAHSYINTTMEARVIGISGEEAFKRSNAEIIKFHPFMISRQNPWICATPDFLVVKEGLRMTVEVKTFTDMGVAAAFFMNIPKRTLVQVWIGMELMGVQDGRIYIYVTDKVARMTTLYGVVKLKRSATFFNQSLWTISCFQYVRFLNEYLEEHEVTPSEDYFDTLALRLVSRFDKSTFQEAEKDKLPRRHYLERPLRIECPFFQKTINDEHIQKESWVPFQKLFASLRFTNTSKKSKKIILNGESRNEILQDIQSKLSQEVRDKLSYLIVQSQKRESTSKLLTRDVKEKVQRTQAPLKQRKEETMDQKMTRLEEELMMAKIEMAQAKTRIRELSEKVSKLQSKKESAKKAQSRRTRNIRIYQLQLKTGKETDKKTTTTQRGTCATKSRRTHDN